MREEAPRESRQTVLIRRSLSPVPIYQGRCRPCILFRQRTGRSRADEP